MARTSLADLSSCLDCLLEAVCLLQALIDLGPVMGGASEW